MTDEELIARLRQHDGWVTLEAHTHLTAADRIEALTEQLAAARQDAKFAEDELEMQEQEACMMENDYIKLEKERAALEGKLAKAVEALEDISGNGNAAGRNPQLMADKAAVTIAKIKGETK